MSSVGLSIADYIAFARTAGAKVPADDVDDEILDDNEDVREGE